MQLLHFKSLLKGYHPHSDSQKVLSSITNMENKLQVEYVIYSLDGHLSGIKENIQVGMETNWREMRKRWRN